MANQRETKAAMRRLMAKYKIEFLGPVESLEEQNKPSSHRTIVSHVQQLGCTRFSQFHETVTVDSDERPWRGQIRNRAQRIVKLANMCLKGRKNELGWRLTLESEIMARFTVEVSCRKCRGRLWRSEQEVTVTPIDEDDVSTDPHDLKVRQEKRKPCACRSMRHREDHLEQGINPLFDDRVDEAIVYDEELRSQLPKREERPDRVFGLRRTKRLDRILWMEGNSGEFAGQSIEENLPTTPFRADGEAILFPFLILEAKSEKGANSFTDIETQTAFAIRELLLLQNGLYQAAVNFEDEGTEPLVWFLSNKGEQWRVSIGYIDSSGSVPRYLVTRIWSGGVDSVDACLQLLLIIDYICDWARDIYRESVINSLRTMIVGDTESLAHDSDIFSLAGNVAQWNNFEGNQPSVEPEESQAESIQNQFHSFNTRTLAIRDASYIRCRFSALYITADNIDSFIQSTVSKAHAKRLATSMLGTFRTALRVEKACLDGLELMWTGTDRESTDLYHPHKMFLAQFTISAYLLPDWQQVLELGYVAIAEEVVDILLKTAEQRSPPERPHSTVIPTDVIHSTFRRMRDQYTPAELLQSCLSWECLTTTFKVVPRAKTWEPRAIYTVERPDGRQPTAILESDRTGKTHNFIWKTYKRFKIGRQEPSSSLFRMSAQVKKQISWENPPELWDPRFRKRQVKESDICLATCTRFFENDTPSLRYGQLCYCLYTLNETLSPRTLAKCITESALLSDVAPLCTARLCEPGAVAGMSRRNWGYDLHELTNPYHKDLIPYLNKLKKSLLGGTKPSTISTSQQRDGPDSQPDLSEAPVTPSISRNHSQSQIINDASGRRNNPIVLDPSSPIEIVSSPFRDLPLPKRSVEDNQDDEVDVGIKEDDEDDNQATSSKRAKIGSEPSSDGDTPDGAEIGALLASRYSYKNS